MDILVRAQLEIRTILDIAKMWLNAIYGTCLVVATG